MAYPTRNWFDRESGEEERSECRNEVGVFRSYIGGGGGATVATGYSVTLKRQGILSFEHQIFFSYGEPIVNGVRCEDGAVLIDTSTGVIRVDSARAGGYWAWPVVYFDGKPSSDGPFLQPARVVELVFGWLLLACGAFGARTLWKSQRRDQVAPLREWNR